MSKINLGDEAEADIRNAVNAGKVATAHENRINFNGWIGEGYTLIDPQGGAGAYMISGGGNGGQILNGGQIFVAAVGIMGVAAIAYQGVLAGVLINPILIAVTLAIAIHVIAIALLVDYQGIKWDDIKGQVTYILGAVVGGIPSGLQSAIRAALGYIIGISGL